MPRPARDGKGGTKDKAVASKGKSDKKIDDIFRSKRLRSQAQKPVRLAKLACHFHLKKPEMLSKACIHKQMVVQHTWLT